MYPDFTFFLYVLAVFLATGLFCALFRRAFPKRKGYLQFTIFSNQTQITGKDMKVRIPVGYSQIVSVTPKDADGNDAKVEKDSVEWNLADEGVATITEVPDDETKARIDIKAAGNTEARSSADSDLNAGPDSVRTITGFIEIEGYELEATSLDIQPSGDIFKTPAPAVP